MVNFRFHIVSLTAVLLALGLGLLLGTTFLDDATVELLRSQLGDLERDVDNARQRNAELEERLGELEQEAAILHEQIGERLFADQLAGAPVLVVATRGIDEATIDGVVAALGQSDADLIGVWWLAEKLQLEDEGQVADLAEALGMSTDDAERLRNSLAVRIADVLYGAADAVDAEVRVGTAGAGGPGQAGAAPGQAAPAEPEALARLREGGFVEYELMEDDSGDVIRLPASGLRIVVVSGPGAAVAPDAVLEPVLSELTSDGPMPVVATQPSSDPEAEEDGDEAPASLVEMIRDDEDLAERVSTVDALDRVSGTVAMVLATVDARPGEPLIGHYGPSDATRLLPPPEEER